MSSPTPTPATATATATATMPIYIFYGTETGNSEAIASQILQGASSEGVRVLTVGGGDGDGAPPGSCFNLTDFKKKLLPTWPTDGLSVFVVSSTGAGDAPDKVTRFWRTLRKLEGSDLFKGVHFALLGLGDTNYDTYQGFPKRLDQKLLELGASSFYARGEADDGTGMEEAVEPWIGGLWDAIRSFSASPSSISTESPSDAVVETGGSGEDGIAASVVTSPSLSETSAPGGETHVEAASVTSLPVNTSTAAPASSPQTSASTSSPALAPSSTVTAPVAKAELSPATPEKAKKVKRKFVRKKKDGKAQPRAPLKAPQCVVKVTKLSKGTTTTGSSPQSHDGSDASHPFWAKVLEVKRLTHRNALKEVLHYRIQAPSSLATPLRAGDAIGILPPNSATVVANLVEILGLEGDDIVSLENELNLTLPSHLQNISPVNLTELLMCVIDLTSLIRKPTLRVLSEYAEDDGEKNELMLMASSSAEGKKLYSEVVEGKMPTIVDLLRLYPSCHPPLGHLLTVLSRAKPRYYSLCSDPQRNPEEFEFAFTVVRNRSEGEGERKLRVGVCTSFLSDISHRGSLQPASLPPLPTHTSTTESPTDTSALTDFQANTIVCENSLRSYFGGLDERVSDDGSGDVYVPIFIRAAALQNFHLSEPLANVIMIGPGTGVAPFRGFLQQRESAPLGGLAGESWLFYGCRDPQLDFLFKEDFEAFHSSGTLTKFVTAFSRVADDHPSKGYVQDRMKVYGSRLVSLMVKGNATCYVCGDAKAMAKDVSSTWVSLLSQELQITEADALAMKNEWVASGKYHVDVW